VSSVHNQIVSTRLN